MYRILVALVAAAATAVAAPPAHARPVADESLGGRCLALTAVGVPQAAPLLLRLQATGLGTYLLHDTDGRLLAAGDGRSVERASRPGAAAVWSARRDGRRLALHAATGRVLAVGPDGGLATAISGSFGAEGFRDRRATGCPAFPEAELNTTGRPRSARRRDGTVRGIADPHLHLTADLRAGGRVIHGRAFHPFGIAEALGGDADDHGPDGTLDITGNLLRSGVPVGTHDTDGWPTFAGWPTHDTNTHQQVYFRWLQRAWLGGMRLVVAQTVEDWPLCTIEPLKSHSCDETETIELEVRRLRELQDHVDAQSGGRGRGWLRLVEDPRAARRVIERGRLAVVIGAESSNLFGCSLLRGVPGCDRAGIDRGIARLRRAGVRSLFLAHWVDNALGGAALEGGDKGTFIGAFNVVQTGSFFRTGPCPLPGQGEEVVPAGPEALSPLLEHLGTMSPEPIPLRPAGRQCNTRGLTALGEYAVRRLMDAHMLIEVDHLSERGRERVLQLAEERGYPLVSSHTGTGGTWTPSELQRLAAVGGFASATLEGAAALPEKVLTLQRRLGRPVAVGLGTDTGGFATLPGPPDPAGPGLAYPFRSHDGGVVFDRQRTGRRTFDLNRDGVAHYGLLPDLLAHTARQPEGRRALGVLFGSAEAYLRTWERTGAR